MGERLAGSYGISIHAKDNPLTPNTLKEGKMEIALIIVSGLLVGMTNNLMGWEPFTKEFFVANAIWVCGLIVGSTF